MRLNRPLARMLLRASSLSLRARCKIYTALRAAGFAAFGSKAAMHPSVRVTGERRIAIGPAVWIGAGSFLHVLNPRGGGVALEIGEGCSLAGDVTVAAAARVTLGRHVLIARGVYVSDHSHAFSDTSRPVM